MLFCGRCGDCCRGGCASTQSPHSLGQLHLDLLPDLLPLLVAADGEDVPVLQLLLAGPVPELHGQQFLPDPAGEGPCGEVTVAEEVRHEQRLGHCVATQEAVDSAWSCRQ